MIETYSWSFLGLNIDGLLAGLATMCIILLTRYACIAGEYHMGKAFRYVFLGFGISGVIASLFFENLLVSAIFAVFGFACLWGIHEVIEQEERVKKGWYPSKNMDPKKD